MTETDINIRETEISLDETNQSDVELLEVSVHRCLNCGSEWGEGDFCPYCGQRSDVARLTLKSMTLYMLSGLSRIDKGFLYTCAQLLVRPWAVIKGYIDGKRRRYTGPVQTLIILCFVSMLVMSWLGHEPETLDLSSIKLSEGNAMGQWMFKLLQWYVDSPTVQNLTMFLPAVPAFMVVTRWRGRQRYNLAECLTGAIYASCALFVLRLLLTLPATLLGDNLTAVKMIYVCLIGSVGLVKSIRYMQLSRWRIVMRVMGFFMLTAINYFLLFVAGAVAVALVIYRDMPG